MLFVDDLVALLRRPCTRRSTRARASATTWAAGPTNAAQLLELISAWSSSCSAARSPESPTPTGGPGDQRVFVADIRKAERELGWTPAIGKHEGIRRLAEWVGANQELFRDV